MAAASINVTDLIDNDRLGALQMRVIVLCAIVALLDGFDVQIVGVAAPAMALSLHISPAALGAALSATLLGLMLGAVTFGTCSDRFGRKRILVVATASFGIFTICTGLVTSLDQLLVVRFLAGTGLGGAMPSFIGLVSDYVPRAKRATLVSLLWTGFPLGGVIGGLLAARFIDALGWQSLFYIGGITPLVLAPLLALALPESIAHLVRIGAAPGKIRHLISHLRPGISIPSDAGFVISDEQLTRATVGLLFSKGRGWITALLWASYFATFLMLITNVGWTPILLHRAGISIARGGLVLAAFNVGGALGTSLAGLLLGRRAPGAILPAAFVGSALMLGLVGQVTMSPLLVTIFEAAAGCCLGAGSSALIALAALFYPTAIRSTGLGWAMSLGRLGSFVGPLVVGVLVSRGWQNASIFAALGAVAICPALCISAIRRESSSGPERLEVIQPLSEPVLEGPV